MKTMASDAGLQGNFKNHSLRATGTTALFDAGVPEAIIQKRTGHKSIDALCCYERTTMDQEVHVSTLLSQPAADLGSFSLTPQDVDLGLSLTSKEVDQLTQWIDLTLPDC